MLAPAKVIGSFENGSQAQICFAEMEHGYPACTVCCGRGVAHPLRFRASMVDGPSCNNDENNTHVVVYFKENLRKDGEAHE